ncbi:MAG: glucose 1-dehydrogenase [Chloroflexi bacterium]|nr:glucose 1-dehydrogenase [Chloroflexota bacterium]
MELDGKVAIVTGGGQGIGRAIARRFARAGACVVLTQRDAARGEATQREIEQAGGRALFVRGDVSERPDVERVVGAAREHYGGVHILVNNAAKTGGNGHLLDMAQEEWDRTIATNLTGAFICAQLAAREMARHRSGSIINVSSTNGQVPQPECAAYAVAKGGLEILTRALAIDLGPYGIRVNTLAPGPVQSRDPDGTPSRPNAHTLVGRTALPDEIAEVALFLSSDASGYLTGERIGVDGGLLINAYSLYGAPLRRADDPKQS